MIALSISRLIITLFKIILWKMVISTPSTLPLVRRYLDETYITQSFPTLCDKLGMTDIYALA